MKIYTLYYYDKEYLEAWLNHYCHLTCIEEIIIQDQNWSTENSLYLYKTVAKYIDLYNVKIVILPSNYKNPNPDRKFNQFREYGESPIRNRVIQFLTRAWILGALDEAIYGESYADTNRKLAAFEKNAKIKDVDTPGFIRMISVTSEGFIPGHHPPARQDVWKHRVTYNVNPLRHQGAPTHDNKMFVYRDEQWVSFTPNSGHYGLYDFQEPDVKLDLNLLHYHPLTRSDQESPTYQPFRKEDIKNLEEHPKYYFDKLIKT